MFCSDYYIIPNMCIIKDSCNSILNCVCMSPTHYTVHIHVHVSRQLPATLHMYMYIT